MFLVVFFSFVWFVSIFYISFEKFCLTILFPSSSSTFIIINLNSFLDILFISISFSSLSEVLSCSFIWNIFCLLILPNFLFLFCLLGRSVIVFQKWSNIENVLWDPEALPLCSSEKYVLMVHPYICVCPSVVTRLTTVGMLVGVVDF